MRGGLKNARVGVIGARPAAFNTVRFSEKLLEQSGISVETIDLSEILGKARRIADGDPRLVSKVEQINAYVPTRQVPTESLLRQARLGIAIDDWMNANRLQASAINAGLRLRNSMALSPAPS